MNAPPPSELVRATEREQQHLLLVTRFGVERESELHAQRPEWRQPSHPATSRVARIVDDVVLVAAIRVAGVEEDDPLEPDRLHEREDDLVVQDELRAAADRCVRVRGAAGVLAELAGAERARLEAADRVDAAREVALEERELVPVDPVVTDAVRTRSPERVGEVPEPLRAQERVVPPRPRLRLEELLAAEAGDLDREVLRRTRSRIEEVVQRVAGDPRRDAADQAGALGLPDGHRRVEADVADPR